jgi:3-hydroxybutyryl-CoA dehydrogenase
LEVSVSASETPTAPPSVVVLGAGTMGAGVALAFALAGSDVALVSRRKQTIDAAAHRIDATLALLARHGIVSDTARDLVRDRIRRTIDLGTIDLAADLIVESIAEDRDAKRELYRQVEPATGAETILATNTSSIALDDLTAELSRPDRFLGYHWFNPAELMALVEVVATSATDPSVVERVLAWSRAIGKEPVSVAHDIDGFIANRLQYALLREAYFLVESGVCSIQDVDLAVTAGLGPRWAALGPFETMDLAGLDVHRAVVARLFPVLSTDKTVPALLERLTQEGALGAKSGRGLRGSYEDGTIQRIVERRTQMLLAAAELRRGSRKLGKVKTVVEGGRG